MIKIQHELQKKKLYTNERSEIMKKKVVIFGGGTGLSTLLKGLKDFPLDITAIITVSDNGRSTGRLREEFNMPAVGDIRQVISNLSDTNESIKQDESLVTYAYNIDREEEKIDFNKTPEEINNLVRGLSPMIGAYFMMDNERMKVYKCRIGTEKYDNIGVINKIYKDGIGISCKDGEIILEEIQPFGKKKMLVSSYLNGIKKEELIGKELE